MTHLNGADAELTQGRAPAAEHHEKEMPNRTALPSDAGAILFIDSFIYLFLICLPV